MKKRFRVLTTVAVSAAMIMSNVMPALAANDGSATGSAAYEGYVEQISAFTVQVPTAAANQFNFTVDPNGLLAGTDYARQLSEDITAANFDTTANLYFENTKKVNDADVKWFTNSSKAIKMENQSSYDVDVEVTAAVTGATGITLVNAEPTATTGDPSLYLAIVTDDTDTDKQTIAITSEGGSYESEIAGVPGNFMIRYIEGEGYKYVQRTNTVTTNKYNKNGDVVTEGGQDGVALTPWNTVSFNLTGKCGGAWTADQSALTIGVSLTWKVTDPEAAPNGPSAAVTTFKKSETTADIDVEFNYGSATAITGVKYSSDGETWATYTNPAKFYTIDNDNNKLTVKSTFVTGLSATRYWRVYFDDSETTYVTLTFTAD